MRARERDCLPLLSALRLSSLHVCNLTHHLSSGPCAGTVPEILHSRCTVQLQREDFNFPRLFLKGSVSCDSETLACDLAFSCPYTSS